MKKLYLTMLSVLFTGLIGISSYAQGTWDADSTLPSIAPATEIGMGITGLTCMHSDISNVVGKGDKDAVAVEYDGVTYENLAMIQGVNNGMFYAWHTAEEGTFVLYVKMSANKKTFIIELTSSCPGSSDLATLTTNFSTADGITGNASYFTTPTVYDTYSQAENTWDGTANASTEIAYIVFSWPVKADKTYVTGCFGSKMMIKGVNYITAASGLENVRTVQLPDIFPNPATGNVTVKMDRSTEIGIYNTAGILLKQQLVTPSDNKVDISGLEQGLYFIRDINGNNKAQKLIVK
jgi:hypothetical protein